MTRLDRVSLIPGSHVTDVDGSYVVVDLLDTQTVLVENAEGKRKKRKVTDLAIGEVAPTNRLVDLALVPREDWDRVCQIVEVLKPLILLGPKKRTKQEVEAAADLLEKHCATVYRWLKEYEKTGVLSCLLRKPRSDKGVNRLDARVEQIIKDCIDTLYLSDQCRSVAKTAEEVRKRCKDERLTPPDPATVSARIDAIDDALKVRKRKGYKAADEQFSPIYGSFPDAEQPLAVVQIDHSPMDVIAVDDIYRLPIGRAYLTIAIDVFSKMIVGFFISLDNPGAMATGVCIARAILGKERLLKRLDLEDLEWPCWGMMRVIHTDNAKEFRGTMLGRAAREYGIIAQRRPRGRPRYGGHVERAFRTYMSEIHGELPGTTFSNPKERLEYDSEGRAVMTVDALEKWFTMFILGVYHQRPHEGNDGLPPIIKWERGILGDPQANGIARGIPARFPDEHRLFLDFSPYVERTVQEYGIAFEGIYYWCDALRRFIHARDKATAKLKRQFICRYDPRDLSKLWFYDEDSSQYIEVPYRNLTRPPVSLWEVRLAKKRLREDSQQSTNEELIFRTIDRMRKLVEDESEKTKSARRMRQRQKGWERSRKKSDSPVAPKAVPAPKPVPVIDHDDDDIEPFDGISEG